MCPPQSQPGSPQTQWSGPSLNQLTVDGSAVGAGAGSMPGAPRAWARNQGWVWKTWLGTTSARMRMPRACASATRASSAALAAERRIDGARLGGPVAVVGRDEVAVAADEVIGRVGVHRREPQRGHAEAIEVAGVERGAHAVERAAGAIARGRRRRQGRPSPSGSDRSSLGRRACRRATPGRSAWPRTPTPSSSGRGRADRARSGSACTCRRPGRRRARSRAWSRRRRRA